MPNFRHLILFLKYNLFAISWTIFLIITMIIPGQETLSEVKEGAYFQGILFAVLAFLLTIGFKKQNDYPKLRFNAPWISVIVLFVLAASLEVLQFWVPDRTFDLWDLLGSCIGVLIGRVFFYYIYGL